MQDVLLVLLLGGGLGWLSRKAHFPNAVAQVLLGVLLGTAVLGWVPHSPILHTLGEAGIVLLLGVAGLEIGIGRMRSAGRTGVAVALLGIGLSMVAGFVVSALYGSPTDEALYVGIALGATSIGITAEVLRQFGLMGHRVADIIVAAAIVDDVIVLYLLGATHGFLSDGLNTGGVVRFIVLAVVVLGLLYAGSRAATLRVHRHPMLRRAWLRSSWVLGAVALGALTTDYFGLSPVVGAFFAGLGVGDGLRRDTRETAAEALQPLVLLTVPFFFVMIGVQAQWRVLAESGLVWMAVLLVVLAISSKVAGGVLGTPGACDRHEKWTVGFGMAPRGEIALVVATLAFQQGHMTQGVFVALVFMTIAAALASPLLMLPFARRVAAATPPPVTSA